MSVHPNSGKAFAEIESEAETLRARILELLADHGPQTVLGLARLAGVDARQYTAPRVTELLDSGEIAEVGSTTCATSGKTVQIVDLASRAPRNRTTLRMVFENDRADDELTVKTLASILLGTALGVVPHLTPSASLSIKRGRKTTPHEVAPIRREP